MEQTTTLYPKYLKEIKTLTYFFKQYFNLSAHEKQTVENDAFMDFLKVITNGTKEGPINSTEYDKYKPIMYTCLRNRINQIFERKNTRKNKPFNKIHSEEYIDDDFAYDNDYITVNLNKLITDLNPKDKAFIRFIYLRGWSVVYAYKAVYSKGNYLTNDKMSGGYDKLYQIFNIIKKKI